MIQISDKHRSALCWLSKANGDLAKAIHAMTDGKYQTAYSKSERVRESMRQLLDVDRNLTMDDRDQPNL